jgi:glutathione peroxidase
MQQLRGFLLGVVLLSFVAPPLWAKGIQKVPLKTLDGKASTLRDYSGQVLLIVNTASQCGYTPQYTGLEALHQRFSSKGFRVLGFPSNDFGGQEPGTNAEIRYFCQSKYKVSFPMFEKGPVSGEKKQALYRELLATSADPSEVQWNFEKFLIGKKGQVLARFRSGVKPDDPKLVSAIEAALQE